MFNTFKISFKLKNTYHVNTIIYSIKQMPIIKKLLPSSLYSHHGLKIFANVISILWEFISMFVSKALYILLMVVLPSAFYKVLPSEAVIHILLFLSVIGIYMNTGVFNPSKDKYYAVVLMKMESRSFALSQYVYIMFRHLMGVIIVLPILAVPMGVSLWFCLIFPLFLLSIKTVYIYYCFIRYQNNKEVYNENNLSKPLWLITALLLILAYGLPYLGFIMTLNVFAIICGLSLIGGIYSLIRVFHYPLFHQMYHDFLRNVNKVLNTNHTQIINNTYHDMINLDESITSKKTGYEYFNELFIKRHRKILWKSSIRQFYIILGLFIIITMFSSIQPIINSYINKSIMMALPFTIFIMYFINTTKTVTQAMFINCDHSMLTYTFYRQPKHVLALFKIRLREMIKINLLPSTTLGVSLSILLYLSGGTIQYMNYIIIVVTIVSLSIFFSTHYLVLYYLLQPYNAFTEVRSSTYSIATSLTYFVCYLFTSLKVDTFVFGIASIIFCIIYCVIASLIIYKKASKTFKLRN